jgi:hypothetical protein
LNPGDCIRIRGICSVFIPILNVSLLFPNFAPLSPVNKYTSYIRIPLADVPELALPLRLKPIRGINLGGLFNEDCKGVYDMCVPVFYNDNFIFGSKKKITCNVMEIDVMIVDIPERWTRFF